VATTKNKKAKNAKNAEGQDQLHDEGYKAILSNVANFLHLLKKYFVASWTADVSAADITRVEKSYITKEYRRVDSDLIYKLRKGDTDVYFYVLLELQSKVDYTMPFRLLRYMVELQNDIFKNTPKKVRQRKDFRLPAIVPIVLYDGNSPWTAVRSFKEYTKNSDIFGNNIIDFEYPVLDLNRMADSEILPVGKLLDAVFSLAKMRFEKKLSPKRVTAWLAEQAPYLSKDDISELANWMTLALKAPPEINKLFEDTLKKGDLVTMKTGFELWADEYRGACVLEGKREEALEIANAMKAAGMDVDIIAKLTKLTVDEIILL
jgi:predicted transposase/invertase (TIGR01784 family)